MEVYLSRQEDFFMTCSNYAAEQRDKLKETGWNVEPEVGNATRVRSRRCARLLFIAQLNHIASDGAWLQQFVFPILSTVIQTPLRAFLPYHSSSHVYGAPWDHTVFLPLFPTGSTRGTVHVVLTVGVPLKYKPGFGDAEGWLQQNDGNLLELNHFVSLSSDGATRTHTVALENTKSRCKSARVAYQEAEAGLAAARQLQPEDESRTRHATSVVQQARDELMARENDCKLLQGTHFVPLSSAKAAARSNEEVLREFEDAEHKLGTINKAEAATGSWPRYTNDAEGADADGNTLGLGPGRGARSGGQHPRDTDTEVDDGVRGIANRKVREDDCRESPTEACAGVTGSDGGGLSTSANVQSGGTKGSASSTAEDKEGPPASRSRRLQHEVAAARPRSAEHEDKERNSGGSTATSEEERGIWEGGDAEGTARVGRAFNVKDSEWETWDGVFGTVMGELRRLGHFTLRQRRVKMTTDKSRYKHCEIVCKHGGYPRKSASGSTTAKHRKSPSTQMGCPFKVTVTWPLEASTPAITSSNCDHNHDPGGAVSSAKTFVEPPSVLEVAQQGGERLRTLGKRKEPPGGANGDDYQNRAPPPDDQNKEGGVHPSEPDGHYAEGRQPFARRDEYATMMERSKNNVCEILRTVPFAKALDIQTELDKLVKSRLSRLRGASKDRNSSKPPTEGRQKKKKERADVVSPLIGNPYGRLAKSSRDNGTTDGLGVGRKRSGNSNRSNRKDPTES
ncbi:unnamed protein product [Ectocarpus sp. 4 AP-2014]